MFARQNTGDPFVAWLMQGSRLDESPLEWHDWSSFGLTSRRQGVTCRELSDFQQPDQSIILSLEDCF
jgi:hypothetical protein